jgi:epoxide hydrolase 4
LDRQFGVSLKEFFVSSEGVKLHVVEAGPEDGPVILLLHGFPEFWWGWNKQIGPLAEAGYRVWAPDQRGYNLSDKPGEMDAYRLDRCARDALNLIQATGCEKAIVAGHDWGGIVAWWLGIHYPERLERLAVLNAPHPFVMRRKLMSNPRQFVRSLYALYFQIPGLPEAMMRADDWKLVVDALEKSSRPGTFRQEDFDKYRQSWWMKRAFTSMLNWYRANLRWPPEFPANVRVEVPTLILWGEKDFALGPELVEPSLDLCSDGRLILFDTATHWLQHEEPERVNSALLDFAGSQPVYAP